MKRITFALLLLLTFAARGQGITANLLLKNINSGRPTLDSLFALNGLVYDAEAGGANGVTIYYYCLPGINFLDADSLMADIGWGKHSYQEYSISYKTANINTYNTLLKGFVKLGFKKKKVQNVALYVNRKHPTIKLFITKAYPNKMGYWLTLVMYSR